VIFPSPRAYVEEIVNANRLYSKKEEVSNFSKSQGLYGGGKIGIFPNPSPYIEG